MIFFIVIVFFLLSSSDASNFVSPLQAPTISPTPGHSNSNCVSVVYDMMDCLSFLNVGSVESSLSEDCCAAVKTVVDYNPQCLCYAIKSSEAMGFTLDNTRAFAMPSICSLSVDPHCATSPASAPSTPPSLTKLPPIIKPSVPTASSPAPSPSKSSSWKLSASKLILAAIIVSASAHVLA